MSQKQSQLLNTTQDVSGFDARDEARWRRNLSVRERLEDLRNDLVRRGLVRPLEGMLLQLLPVEMDEMGQRKRRCKSWQRNTHSERLSSASISSSLVNCMTR